MSVHTEKFTFIDNFMKPCSKDSDCGVGVQCQGPIGAKPGSYCHETQIFCDNSTCDCTAMKKTNMGTMKMLKIASGIASVHILLFMSQNEGTIARITGIVNARNLLKAPTFVLVNLYLTP
eukprot:TRINITY_DN2717_c0_g1_i1.p1 TRINITY_DN2717_c0_g1~~TRINITY_DN2717_c0_g1_i1.p1  ORF type:complete len:120 (-),score=18.71 TRINITY_DN2717_c0_g1_i1:209-568(-)